MNARPHLVAALPRLTPSQGRAALAWNATGLFGIALIGAAIVHLLAYHLPLGLPPGSRWAAAALALLARCPLSGLLGAVAAIAALAVVLALWELHRLKRLDATLGRLTAAMHTTPAPLEDAGPRSLTRLAGFIVALLGMQLALTGLVDTFCPMRAGMVMNGVHMTMTLTPALPLGPLHLIVAALLALLLWRVERRLTRLRARIAHRLVLLARASAAGARPPMRRATPLFRGWQGHALFARPPPLAA